MTVIDFVWVFWLGGVASVFLMTKQGGKFGLPMWKRVFASTCWPIAYFVL